MLILRIASDAFTGFPCKVAVLGLTGTRRNGLHELLTYSTTSWENLSLIIVLIFVTWCIVHYTKGAYHLSELTGQSGGLECETGFLHKVFAQVLHNSV